MQLHSVEGRAGDNDILPGKVNKYLFAVHYVPTSFKYHSNKTVIRVRLCIEVQIFARYIELIISLRSVLYFVPKCFCGFTFSRVFTYYFVKMNSTLCLISNLGIQGYYIAMCANMNAVNLFG